MSNYKINEDERTFETRVKFINNIFSDKYTNSAIMAHCIQYKLGKSYENYIKEVSESVWNLEGKDPMKILKKIDR